MQYSTADSAEQLGATDLPKVPIYVAARVGFEPVTFRTQGAEPTTEPPRPHNQFHSPRPKNSLILF